MEDKKLIALYVSTSNYTTIINNSTVINNIQVNDSRHVRYNAGPDRNDVERRAGKRFVPVAIKESSRPAQRLTRNELQIYRPQVQKNVSAERRPAPSRVQGWKRDQPTNQQPGQQKRNDRPTRQEPQPQRRNDQPARQEPVQRKRNDQPTRQEPQPQRHNDQPKQQPDRQRQPQPRKDNPSGKKDN